MTPEGKRKLIIISSIVAIAGIVGFVLWKRKKDKPKDEQKDFTPVDEPNVTNISTQGPVYTGGGSGFSFPFKTTDEGNKFRGWVNDKYPDYAKTNSLDRSGSLNAFVQKAWDVYGAEYSKAMGLTTGSVTSSAIDQGFIDAWNIAKKGAWGFIPNTFTYKGKIYDTKTGKAVQAEQLIGRMTWAIGRTPVFADPQATFFAGAAVNSVGFVSEPNAVGKIRGFFRDKENSEWYNVELVTSITKDTGLVSSGATYTSGWVLSRTVTKK